jgi:hypothetical protein
MRVGYRKIGYSVKHWNVDLPTTNGFEKAKVNGKPDKVLCFLMAIIIPKSCVEKGIFYGEEVSPPCQIPGIRY